MNFGIYLSTTNCTYCSFCHNFTILTHSKSILKDKYSRDQTKITRTHLLGLTSARLGPLTYTWRLEKQRSSQTFTHLTTYVQYGTHTQCTKYIISHPASPSDNFTFAQVPLFLSLVACCAQFITIIRWQYFSHNTYAYTHMFVACAACGSYIIHETYVSISVH